MKKIFALVLCLALMAALALPVMAADTIGTIPEPAPQQTTNPSDVMAVLCLIIVIVGGIYLIITFRRSGRNR